jgi:hypothetical protein
MLAALTHPPRCLKVLWLRRSAHLPVHHSVSMLARPARCIPSRGDYCLAVVVPFESPEKPSIDPLLDLVSADMERVNSVILSRTGS